ncbi:multicomponent Na+:H+ antiporter subunit G [Rhodobium orientis]|uniref:Na+/H+ antiporter subunit G n=1 Tax=Rhodobium orientis TaxID=34017 RepID=A0A327JI51_9HYPH|nr:monovalent cation/H(+) antiporter subunit G [Rhodobium orientis]MBB4303794.1 multicomponent Na+:H+ antiporter subunit G [Rhodobium orientis]MBK5947912.1 Na+/H+ antiporter subunit G [Rhodobium orientis]RAI26077.1 Na+/H+ antiporter subunit G [Rhodobium orientis]
MSDVQNIAVGLILLTGSFFAFVASIGLLRLRDIYMRMHAASKAGTLGSGLMMVGLAVYAAEIDVISRALAGVVFFLLTTPVSTHLLARAAYLVGHKPAEETRIDDYADAVKFDRDS